MSKFIDKSYLYVMNNFIRLGMLLLLIGVVLMLMGFINKNLNSAVSFTVAGGFIFLSGIIMIVSGPKSTN